MSLELPHDESPDEILLGDLVDLPAEPTYVPQAVNTHSSIAPHFRSDVVLAESAELDDTVPALAPPEGLSPTERRAISLAPIPLTIEDDAQKLSQFTLWELMILMTFLSIGLSTLYYLPPQQVAGVLGLLALIGQGLLMRFPPENRHINLAAWCMLGMYFVAVVVALCQHGWS